MSFGGFGGVPRKPSERHKPVLGVVQNPTNQRKGHVPDLGVVQSSPIPRKERVPELGIVKGGALWKRSPRDPLQIVPGMIHPPQTGLKHQNISYVPGPLPVFHVVILSKLASNLKVCLRWLLAEEGSLPHERVIVVDDGAGAECKSLFPKIRFIPGVQPFVFSRNANIGIRAAGSDVIILNDDAHLLTVGGFSKMARVVSGCPDLGLCSSSLWNGVESGNLNQVAVSTDKLRAEQKLLTFVCVYIPKSTINKVGFLDEQFVGYGYDDNDYCLRVRQAGLRMGVYDGCVVDHGEKERSTYRIKPNHSSLMSENRRRFESKWGTKA